MLVAGATAQNMKFSIKDFSSKCGRETGDLVTFTAEILNGKLYFLSSDALFNSFSYIIIIIFLLASIDSHENF